MNLFIAIDRPTFQIDPLPKNDKSLHIVVGILVSILSLLVVFVFLTLKPTDTSVLSDKSVPPASIPTIKYSESQTEQSCESKGDLIIESTERIGFCKLTHPLENFRISGLSMIIPVSWARNAEIRGAAGSNISFSKNIFLYVMKTDLGIEQADMENSRFEMASEPIVNDNEKILSRKLGTIEGKKVLVLTTSKEEAYIKRYFVKNTVKESNTNISDTLYVFELKSSENFSEIDDVTTSTEAVLGSITFLN